MRSDVTENNALNCPKDAITCPLPLSMINVDLLEQGTLPKIRIYVHMW